MKQEISELEAENAELENLRVTAEMKVVDLEEQLDKVQSSPVASDAAATNAELQRLILENERLQQKLNEAVAMKSSSEVSSTESFIKAGSNVDSTESFEALSVDAERADLLKKIESLTRENGALSGKLMRYEEKAASDSGSTESFEKVPENASENLSRENQELINKLALLEEKIQQLSEENEKLLTEIQVDRSDLQSKDKDPIDEESTSTAEPLTAATSNVQEELSSEIDRLTLFNEEMKTSLLKLEKEKEELIAKIEVSTTDDLKTKIILLQSEMEHSQNVIVEQQSLIDEIKSKLADKDAEIENLMQQSKFNKLELTKTSEQLKAMVAENNDIVKEHELLREMVESLREEQAIAMNNYNSEVSDLMSQIEGKSVLEKEIQDEHERKLQTLTDDYNLKINKLMKENEETRSSLLSERDHEIEKIKETCNVAELQEQLQQKNITIASLSEEIEKLMNNSSVIEEDLFTARHQIQTLNNKLEKSKSVDEYNEVLGNLGDRELKVVELSDMLNRKQDHIDTLKTQLEAATIDNQELSEKLSIEKSKFIDVHEQYLIQVEEINNLKRSKADVENTLLNLQLIHDEALQHAKNVSAELQEAYISLELLKNKHTGDMSMLNRRLEDVIEDLQAKTNELESVQIELNEKTIQLEKCVPGDVQSDLEKQLAEHKQLLAEGEEKAQAQLEKMKKYAALAKKKNQLCEELENKMKELTDKHSADLADRDAKNQALANENEEMSKRIDEIKVELEAALSERDESLKISNTNLAMAYQNIEELNDKIADLGVAKESARELGVRMSVMESEYLEQRTLINTLETENRLLLARQAQINERLENVEKESEERRQLLEKMEKEKEIAESEPKPAESCSRCAILEAKLQERDAEIENLDNELHNSIDNLVQMQESLRMSSVTDASYNELMQRYNLLLASNEETIAKLETALRDNEALNGQMASLQEAEADLRESMERLKSELAAAAVALADRPSEAVVTATSSHQPLVTSSAPEQDVQPFDASVFGPSLVSSSSVAAATANSELELEIARLTDEMGSRLEEQRATFASIEDGLRAELEQARAVVERISSELNDAHDRLHSADEELRQGRELTAENEKLAFQLNELLSQKRELEDELDKTMDFELEPESVSTAEKLRKTLENYNLKLAEFTSSLDASKAENQQLHDAQRVQDQRVVELEEELKRSADDTVVRASELEARVSMLSEERDSLQAQYDQAIREYENLKESTAGLSSLQLQLDGVVQERNELIEELKSLRASVSSSQQEAAAASSVQQQVPVEEESIQSLLAVSGWDDDVIGGGPSSSETTGNSEAQLQSRIELLEEKLQDLSHENTKHVEESKVAQVKIGRYVKKLKEYKVQLDSLQRELRTSQTVGAFDDLSAAIEEELKAQVAALEKALQEAKDELKKAAAEKEQLSKKIETLSAASETIAESKTKQEHEVHVWQMRYKELEMKLQSIESGAESPQAPDPSQSQAQPSQPETAAGCDPSEFEALVKQNEELEQALEEYRLKVMSSEKAAMHAKELASSYASLQETYDKLKADYDALRRQFEQSLMDANDQVQNERQKCELLQITLEEKAMEAEKLAVQLSAAIEEKTNAAAELDQLSQRLADESRQLARLEEDKAALEMCAQTLERELAEKRLLVEQLHGMESSIGGYVTGLQEGHAEIQALQDKLRATESDNAKVVHELTEEVRALRERLSETIEQRDAVAERSEVQLSRCEGDSALLRQDLSKEVEHAQALEKQSQDFAVERETLKSAVETLTAELDGRASELQALQADNACLRDKIEAANAEMAEARERYEAQLDDYEMKAQLALMSSLDQIEANKATGKSEQPESAAPTQVVEEISMFTFADSTGAKDNEEELNRLRADIKAKDEVIEHLQYSINESTTTKTLQALQENINALHNEKDVLERQLVAKNEEIHALAVSSPTTRRN